MQMYYVRVYDDAGNQKGVAFKATARQLQDLQADLPEGWNAVGRKCK